MWPVFSAMTPSGSSLKEMILIPFLPFALHCLSNFCSVSRFVVATCAPATRPHTSRIVLIFSGLPFFPMSDWPTLR